MKNKQLKQEMLENGKYHILQEFDKRLYRDFQLGIKDYLTGDNDIEIIANMSELICIINEQYQTEITARELKAYIQLIKNKRQKGSRLKNHINYYARNDFKIVFATFTFSDTSLLLDEKYRWKEITRALHKNENIIDYIGNIDFGDIKGREHYHYILILKKDFEPITKVTTITSKEIRKFNEVLNLDINYKLGFTTYELVANGENDINKLKNYITKLTLHALKQEKRYQLITRRDSPYHDYQKKIENHKKEMKEAKQERKEQRRLTKIKKIEEEYQMSFDQINRLNS